MADVELIRTLREAGLAVPIDPAEVQFMRRPGTPRPPVAEHDPHRAIGLRTHVEPAGWTPKHRQWRTPTPDAALLILTLGRDRPGERLQAGVAALTIEGQAGFAGRWLFYADDAKPFEVETLHRIAAEQGWPVPIPRSEFAEVALWRIGYKGRAGLVAWHIPTELGRLAVDWAPATGSYRGGWSLILHTFPGEPTGKRPRLRNGQVEDGFRPRFQLRAIDGVRALVGVAQPRQIDQADRGGARAVWSVQALAEAQTGDMFRNLAEAAAAYGIGYGTRRGGRALTDRLGDAIADLRVLAELHRRTLWVHQQLSPDRPPNAAMSPGSYAKALLGRMGLEPPLARQPDFPRPILAGFMGAFYAGDVDVAVRAHDLPVRYLDIGGAYGVAAVLCGEDALLAARRVRVYEGDTEGTARYLERLARRINRWLRHGEVGPAPLSGRDWRRLARTLVWLRPDGDVLPHRVLIRGSWHMTIAPLTWPEPLPYILADALGSLLVTGSIPELLRVVRVSPWGRQPTRPVRLPTGKAIIPGDNPVYLANLERIRLEGDQARPEWLRSLLRSSLKGIVNSMAAGLPVQVLDDEPTTKKRPELVWDPSTGQVEEQRVPVIETPGEWYFPPAAAGETASARLLLHLIRLAVEARGGTVAYWDTDSVMVIATPEGGLIPMPGGPLRTPDGQEAVLALSFREVEEVRWQMEVFSPWPDELQPWLNCFDPDSGYPVRVRQPRLLKVEPENQPPPGSLGLPRVGLLVKTVSSKRYDPWWRIEPGDHLEHRNGKPTIVPPTPEQLHDLSRVQVVGASRHGATHLPPAGADPDHWVDDLAAALITRHADVEPEEPGFGNGAAITVIPVTRPAIARLYPKARPYSRIAIWSAFLGAGRYVAAWHPGFNPWKADWRNPETRDRTRPLPQDQAVVRGACGFLGDTYATAFARLRRTPQRTALTADGHPCGPRTRGLLHPAPTDCAGIELIGRESRRWRDGRGILDPPDYVTYRQPDNWPVTLSTIRALADRMERVALAKEIGVSSRTLRYLLCERAPSMRTRIRIGQALRSLDCIDGAGVLERVCDGCGKPLTGLNPRRQYCSPGCRQHSHRTRTKNAAPGPS